MSLRNRRPRLFVIQSWLNPLLQKRLHLLRSPPNKGLGVQQRLQLILDRIEVRVCLYPRYQVVRQPELLDLEGGFVGENLQIGKQISERLNHEIRQTYPDLLVRLLPITTFLDDSHDYVLRCHKWELLGDPALNDLRVDDHPLGDVLHS